MPELLTASRRSSVRVVCVMDPGSPREAQARVQAYEGYKADRGPCPEDLSPQFDLVKEAAQHYGFTVATPPPTHEADDLIATYVAAAREGRVPGVKNVIIISYDKDLMQLITDERETDAGGANGVIVRQMNPSHLSWSGPLEVEDQFGVRPKQLVDYLALVGDRSDCVPGVDGIGKKSASTLLGNFETLDGVLAAAVEGASGMSKKREETLRSEEGRANALLSRQLVELEERLVLPEAAATAPNPVPDLDDSRIVTVEDAKGAGLDNDGFVESVVAFLRRSELRSLATTLERKHGNGGTDWWET
mmetsp:Transcript_19618/g.59389  ORF Transcript_19618/g.59389 Transcript_19618/m.59389 type:complete len:304 (-) Transcript_19618:71-982(-)